MKLRTYLMLVVGAAVLPLLIFAGVQLVTFNNQQRAVQVRELVNMVHALCLALDREVAASIRVLKALGTSKYLDSGNLKQFHEQATRVLEAHGGWEAIVMTEASGQQVVNTKFPFGSSLPRYGDLRFIEEMVKTQRAVASNLFLGAVVKRPLIAVGLPLTRDGQMKYTLTASASPAFLAELLSQQKLPPGWGKADHRYRPGGGRAAEGQNGLSDRSRGQ